MKNAPLPPGQRALSGFPRFGVTFGEAPPRMAGSASIRITGAVARVSDIPVVRLAELKRTEQVADFHCVTGWSARELAWQGVAFRTFYEHVIAGGAGVHPDVSHIRFHGADGYAAVLLLADALDETALLADRLGGVPLTREHGALLRLVSPKQYGYMNVKHIDRIELCVGEPPSREHDGLLHNFFLRLVKPHPRARVELEERHRYLPSGMVRPIYRMLIPPFMWLARRGAPR